MPAPTVSLSTQMLLSHIDEPEQGQPECLQAPSVSEVLAYHHGQNELAIEAELELDVREAPLRELLLRVPKGYAIARINASGMSDYFLREPTDETDAELRLVSRPL